MLPTGLKPMVCRHEYSWSERRQIERCHKCGKARALNGADRHGAAGRPAILAASPQPSPVPQGVRAAESVRVVESATLNGPGEAGGRLGVTRRLDHLIAGPLSREQTIRLVLALIDDAHSHQPELIGSSAAVYYAQLEQALHAGPTVKAA